MKKILLFLVCLVCLALGQEQENSEPTKVLHVSTIPSYADIYINQLHPNHVKNPQATSPEFITVTSENSQDNEILISLFKPEFADTTIRVKLSAKDTSYLIVSLRPNYDKTIQEEQEKIVKKRHNRNFGKKMIFGSFIPFAVSAISGGITYYQINKANDAKKKMENSPLADVKKINEIQKEFEQHRDNADIGKTFVNVGISLGASLLAVGVILQF
ncbi:MAG: hypothetical protein MJZ05_11120 [Fibrobacter sp.]|nr:hypothetical protein [Fibrobacter sp.]